MNPIPQECKDKLIVLYKQMYELTLPECKNSCRCPLSCCGRMHCDIAKETAKQLWNIDLIPTDHPTLPFMSDKGCTVPPHLRPMCTLHTCSINSLGFKKGDIRWTQKYFKLREDINEIENSLT